MSILESASSHFGKAPHLHSAAARPQPSMGPTSPGVSPAQETLAGPDPANLSAALKADPLRMATIEEDNSGDFSHLNEEAGFRQSDTAARSFEDLTGQATSFHGDKRRLTRQARIDSKETECWDSQKWLALRMQSGFILLVHLKVYVMCKLLTHFAWFLEIVLHSFNAQL